MEIRFEIENGRYYSPPRRCAQWTLGRFGEVFYINYSTFDDILYFNGTDWLVPRFPKLLLKAEKQLA